MKTDRRTFVKLSGLAGAGLLLPGLPACTGPEDEHLVILHTNDVHSRVDPFPEDHPKLGGLGGAARRARLVQEIRATHRHVLLLDAGDIFQGTPYFNFFKGELEFKLMSQMKYDAATLGNHDFDAGLDGLVKQLPHASFPFVCANYSFGRTELRERVLSNLLLQRGRLRIGIFGVGIQLEGLVDPVMFGDTKYIDPVEVASSQVNDLLNRGADYIICLSHLGYQYESDKICDTELARQVPGINLIIGGHTHTFLEAGDRVDHASGSSTHIVQAGWGGAFLGRVDVLFRPGKKAEVTSGLLT